MLVSHRHRFIYTKTAKTAGTSVEAYYEKYCLPEGDSPFSHTRRACVSEAGIVGYRGGSPFGGKWYNHMPAAQIRRQIGDDIWNSYFKFCIVRNPFDKLISGFQMFERQRDRHTTTQKIIVSVRKILGVPNPIDCVSGENTVARFRSWIKNGGWIDDRDKYMIDGKVCVDYFIRYEQLQDGIKHVCEQVGVPFAPDQIPKLKSGKRTDDVPITDYYDAETARIVSARYTFELAEFGYSLPK